MKYKHAKGPRGHGMCCEAAGGAEAKTGKNRTALSRPAGMSATLSATVDSKTRSRHHAGSTAYHWTGCSGYGANENINGY